MRYTKRRCYAIEIVKSVIRRLELDRLYSEKRVEALRPWMPYCICKVGDGWQIYNRDYKPLGLSEYDNYVKYEAFPFLIVERSEIDFSVFDSKCNQLNHEEPAVFFYTDSKYPSTKKLLKTYVGMLFKAFKL